MEKIFVIIGIKDNKFQIKSKYCSIMPHDKSQFALCESLRPYYLRCEGKKLLVMCWPFSFYTSALYNWAPSWILTPEILSIDINPLFDWLSPLSDN